MEHNIKEQEQKLFVRWREAVAKRDRKEIFVRDGLVNEKEWFASSPRMVFILKEANDRNGREFDLITDCLLNQPTATTWKNVARWSYGIQELWHAGGVELPWRTVQDPKGAVGRGNWQKQLYPLCVMNLSKIPGGPRTNTASLATKFSPFQQCFAEQFGLYKEHADLVICCGDAVARLSLPVITRHVYGYTYQCGQGRQEEGGYWYYKITNGPYVISVPHPQASIRHEEMYGKLMYTVRIIFEERFGGRA
ncbi:hypothetical protein [Alistipes communis]|uniref:hypothetical protein n=1 Tax=Alistipes communis TaxID=2585118 RepID=UPI003AF8E3FD